MKIYVGLMSLVLFSLTAQAADPVVEAMSVRQRANSKLVDIDYTVTDADSSVLAVGLQVVDNETGVSIGVRSLLGETQIEPGSHRLTWDAGADWDGKVSNNLSFTLVVSDQPARFIVIDISGGAAATSYPYTEGPVANWENDPAYKTTKILLRKLPAGTFVMGSPADELNHRVTEIQHQVTLSKPFYMGVFELTQHQWQLVMGALPTETDLFGQTLPVQFASWVDSRGGVWPDGVPGSESFLGRLRAKTGLPLDLPTEAQWEYACRAGTAKAFYNDTDCLVTDNSPDVNVEPLAWYVANSDSRVHPVGLKQANNWGLFDMAGNVLEWCLDWTYVEPDNSPVVDPVGAPDGDRRVLRGGAFSSRSRHCRSAYDVMTYDYTRSGTIGVRISCGELK